MNTAPRYDGHAQWYEERFAGYAQGELSSAGHLARLLGAGSGWCLDVGCGTGLHFDSVASTGRRVVGVDISVDQLSVAAGRSTTIACADATLLPFADGSFEAVVATYLHTDVDDVAPVFAEIERVLRPAGRLVYLGTHPCFVGQFVELRDETTKIVHPGYRDGGWHRDSPTSGSTGAGAGSGTGTCRWASSSARRSLPGSG